ncbi:MAG: DNA translocase FtsK 4TM domain-containing protein [Bacteroidaceae bacterium]|nr:DNA translocase FtsK 4TM domain-containing protein [Bacteroidaceae bacterium]
MAAKKKRNSREVSRSKAAKSKGVRSKGAKSKSTKNSKPKGLSLKDWISSIKSGDTARFIVGLMLIGLALFLAISFISFIFSGKEDAVNLEVITGKSAGAIEHVSNSGGTLGLRAANYFMQQGFGFPALFIPIFMVLLAMKLMKTHFVKITQQFINCGFLMVWGSVALAYFLPNGQGIFLPGGQHGINICNFLTSTIGDIGLVMLLAITMIIFCIYLTTKTIEVVRKMMHVEKPIKELAGKVKDRIGNTTDEDYKDTADEPEGVDEFPEEIGPTVIDFTEEQETPSDEPVEIPEETETPEETEPGEGHNADNEITLEIEIPEDEPADYGSDSDDVFSDEEYDMRGDLSTPYDPHLDFEFYKAPTVDLLKKYPDQDAAAIDMDEQQANKERIITVLRNFGVEISTIKATVGPTITLYEITPAVGVRIAKIRNLEDDIALSLSAIGIRIIAPIPGKGTIGIEVPNAKPKIVSMESIINSRKFQECDYDLPIALGRTITNDIYIQDLAKMPHLLVAGATGQGKSVGLNAIITSLLYKKHPTELKLVLVDPKKVEFSVYAPLEYNFMAEIDESKGEPVITDTDRVKHTLKSLCKEMDDRYLLLQSVRCRTIKEYNEKFCARRLNPQHGHRYLPYIVVVIDEFGDLIMVAGKEIEYPITRIAQLARAVGIHMVIATQRPTTNIITGNIKANFPARMAFRVMAAIDSRTILDQTGANQLIGRGDMLFLANGKQVERVQCAFVDTPEVEDICEFISSQDGPLQPYLLPEVSMDDGEMGGEAADGGGSVGRYDDMFVDVARYVVNGQQGSTSAIQRTFAIGYNRAGRLMDQLEKAKIVGPARGSKPRDVLILDEADLNAKLQALGLM